MHVAYFQCSNVFLCVSYQSLFPRNVRDRLLQMDNNKTRKGDNFALAPNNRIKNLLNGNSVMNDNRNYGNQPIADLFPNCTVYFADIAGFTAWSSTREPAQVFMLLQAVYQAFDRLAKKRHVFKVETIGDSYVAVTGLPEAQPNHAVIMVRFASGCMHKMATITKELEVSLGPDTGDLGLRFGLHSGPVTAGVLRGDRARFQLFGDTVNTGKPSPHQRPFVMITLLLARLTFQLRYLTASRMESTGVRGMIQVSQSTADALILAGKGHWLKSREDAVQVKGKGVLNTYWANPGLSKPHNNTSMTEGSADESKHIGLHNGHTVSQEEIADSEEEKLRTDRLVEWIVDILVDHIRKIVSCP
jgi:hypothetical protein